MSGRNKLKEAIFSRDHTEIINSAWANIPVEQKKIFMTSIVKSLQQLHPDEEDPRYGEVVRAAWCLGFHYCMIMMEQGALIKAGKVKPENN